MSTAQNKPQSTQYDNIGKKYEKGFVMPAVEPEALSVIKALGDVRGKRCLDLACGTGRYTHLLHTLGAASIHAFDISPAMIAAAQSSYPAETYPNIRFAVADCSKPLPLDQPDGEANENFDIIFAGWFLNYAGTEEELEGMFRVIRSNLAEGGRFGGITTDVSDARMHLPKHDFYGIDVEVLNPEYRAPSSPLPSTSSTRVTFRDAGISFECFQFKKEVYERCAARAGMKLTWAELVLPEDERKEDGFWERWLERPTFSVVVGESA
ncbi:S-adenosyl-L-methionine-dependent methyltransferase [Westerdykella ornata]|uniref:S-adenosyl-L-methionine-dependent methyltransferase n=1 Tax=Westerdykella ornata TaxID=318751 RepID=A0A6A6JEF1_WESOR|nr:S-adenosyl-L-methionine-dependent methyltransferase [Westerdykella ornata]KAF2274378.1 S-adenosyl-L-methionine-dependent methyltransferase [Westerdykella ornata]